jgi:hypothetical protein
MAQAVGQLSVDIRNFGLTWKVLKSTGSQNQKWY